MDLIDGQLIIKQTRRRRKWSNGVPSYPRRVLDFAVELLLLPKVVVHHPLLISCLRFFLFDGLNLLLIIIILYFFRLKTKYNRQN